MEQFLRRFKAMIEEADTLRGKLEDSAPFPHDGRRSDSNGVSAVY